MTETLFERYKEALRSGHVAVLRGRLEDAATAYRAAIEIAADRAVPRTALGGVQLRMGNPADALDAFDGALALDPADDGALVGRAQALVVLRRTSEAALAYDQLVEVRTAGARLAEAVEAARRALAIEPSDGRRECHATLVETLRTTAASTGADGAAAPGSTEEAGPDLAEPGDGDTTRVAGGTEVAAGEDAGPAAEGDGVAVGGDAEPAAETALEPAPELRPDPEALVLALEEAAARGDIESAAAAALAAAQAHREDGRIDAAFDACLLGIGLRPGDVDLHLMLADLAIDRGWTGQAGEAYRQLLRLADLDGDAAAADLVRRAAAARLPGDPRFAAE